jgi:hypothetical protein
VKAYLLKTKNACILMHSKLVDNFSSKCAKTDAEILGREGIKGQGAQDGGGDPTLLRNLKTKKPLTVSFCDLVK